MACIGMYVGIPLSEIADSTIFYAVAGLGGLDWAVARLKEKK